MINSGSAPQSGNAKHPMGANLGARLRAHAYT
jgi:hypothetical protein